VRQLFYELGLQMGRLRVKIGTQVKVAYWLLGIALIIVHGIWPNQFKVDEFSVLIYFILSIPFVAQYLIKAKFPGGEFIFRDKIEKAEELVQKSIEIAEEAERDGKTKPLPFETFQLSQVREVLEYDQVLALAALRIEIERKLRLLGVFLKISENKREPLNKLIVLFGETELLSIEQISALREILNMCNKAIHGHEVTADEAREIIDLAEELNRTFSAGYSIDLTANQDFERQGLFCEWEHCIELMPLAEVPSDVSCPVFGHDCPGGLEKASNCDKTLEDLPANRFIK
jgi:hypothetical protein